MSKKIKGNPIKHTKKTTGSPQPSPNAQQQRMGADTVVFDQMCHLNEAVTRLSKRTERTNKMLESMVELQQSQLDQSEKTNALLLRIEEELEQSKEVLTFMSKEVDKLEDVARQTDAAADRHNEYMKKALTSLIIALHGEDEIDRIISKAEEIVGNDSEK